jgi:hypothetical protein
MRVSFILSLNVPVQISKWGPKHKELRGLHRGTESLTPKHLLANMRLLIHKRLALCHRSRLMQEVGNCAGKCCFSSHLDMIKINSFSAFVHCSATISRKSRNCLKLDIQNSQKIWHHLEAILPSSSLCYYTIARYLVCNLLRHHHAWVKICCPFNPLSWDTPHNFSATCGKALDLQ